MAVTLPSIRSTALNPIHHGRFKSRGHFNLVLQWRGSCTAAPDGQQACTFRSFQGGPDYTQMHSQDQPTLQ